MKTAIIILSDPKNGGDEALGRLLNGLVVARESIEKGDDVAITFSGPGTRWIEALTKPGHPASALYDSVRPHVLGASFGCATIFGAADKVQAAGMTALKEFTVPGAPPVASLRRFLAEGWNTIVF